MTGGHLTPRRFRGALLLGTILVFLAVAAFLWWRWTNAPPQARAGSFLAESPALEFPSRPEGIVVLARPGGWARFLAQNPSRAVLLDPSWWQSLAVGSTRQGSSAAAPGGAAALLLDQLRHGLVVAWWKGAWIVQGAVPGGDNARRLGALLPQHLAGKWRLENGVLRIASDPSLLEGRDWKVRPSVDPSRRLACWVWLEGAQWPGWWEKGELVLERGRAGKTSLPEARGALLARVEDGRRLLDLVGSRIPSRGLLEGIGRQLDGLLSRPVGLWLRRLEVGPALPRPLMALELGLLEGEDGHRVAGALREVLCPFGCTTEEAVLSDGRPAERWESAMGTWWAVVVPGDAVVAATARGQLETLLGARTAWPRGDWAVVSGDAAASSLRALASARLLTVLGLARNDQLDRMRRLSVPLQGLKTLRWLRGPKGVRIELQPAPAK